MKVPAEVLDPWKKEMTGKANLFTERSHLWISERSHLWTFGYQCHDTKSKIRLIRFLTKGDHMEEEEFVEVG